MPMYDYLLRYPDESSAKAALPAWLDDDGNWQHAYQGTGSMAITIIAQEAVMDGEELVSPQVNIPGYWVAIATPAIDEDVWALAVQESQRPERSEYPEGRPYQDCVTRTRLDADAYAAFTNVSPVFAGAMYRF